MNETAKIGLLFTLVVVALCFGGKHLLGDGGRGNEYLEALEKRPYTERNLAEEYGLDPNWQPRNDGPLSGMHSATYHHKLNNCLASEASRIQIEFEEHLRMAGTFLSYAFSPVDADRIARQRFEDQGLIPPKSAGE